METLQHSIIFSNTDKAQIAFIIAAILDVCLTFYGMSLGYPEGNPLFAWIQSDFVILVLLIVCVPLSVFAVEGIALVFNAVSYLPTIFSVLAVYRFIFGPFGWMIYILSSGTMYLPINSIEHVIQIGMSVL